ncbi:MAG: MBL fold metallo-hydrolase, partial [Eubacteriales bacterium]
KKIEYVFLTHEHIDHVKSVSVMAKKLENAAFYASAGTWDDIESKKISHEKRNFISAGQSLVIKDIKVTAFELSHDANEPLGYLFQSGAAGIVIVTDTGRITSRCKKALQDADILILESNYEEALLMASDKYPWPLKQRIMSKYGHLSNDEAAQIVENLINKGANCKLKTLILAHLSKETNYPQLAYQSMDAKLSEICSLEHKIYLDVARRDVRSKVYIIG